VTTSFWIERRTGHSASMGQAKQKKLNGAKVTWCRNCTLCCELPEILELEKASYKRCGSSCASSGCSIYEERPAVCRTFECRFVSARLNDAPDRHAIPHPSDCGAYFFEVKGEKRFVVFVDPRKPEKWKESSLVLYLESYRSFGFEITIFDRGYKFDVARVWDDFLQGDWVKVAQAHGEKMHDLSFRDWRA